MTLLKHTCAIVAIGLLGYMLAIAIVTGDADVLELGIVGVFFS